MITKFLDRLAAAYGERRTIYVPIIALFLCYTAAGMLARYSYLSSSNDTMRNQRLRSVTTEIYSYAAENNHAQLDFLNFLLNPRPDLLAHFQNHQVRLKGLHDVLENRLDSEKEELDASTIPLFSEIENHQEKMFLRWGNAVRAFQNSKNQSIKVSLSNSLEIQQEIEDSFAKFSAVIQSHIAHCDRVASQNRDAVAKRLILYGVLATVVFCLLLYIIITSIKRERSLINQLVQNEKLSSLGQMSAGIAHELNTPLMYIQGYAGRIRSTLRKSKLEIPALNEYLAEVDEGIERMSMIIGHLRDFSRKDDKNKKLFSPEKSISRAFDFFGEQLAQHGIDVQLLLDAGGMKILGTSNRFEQIFINLISNARDALNSMPDNRNKYIRVVCQNVDRSIAIRFEDNGPGIPEDKRNLVFEPFYTTKPMGSGTGLGLSIVHEIVTEHRGKITLTSNPKTGTVFTIVVPGAEL